MTSHLVFYATVLSLSVLPDGDQVDVIIASLVTLNRATGTNVGIQAENPVPDNQKLPNYSNYSRLTYIASSIGLNQAINKKRK